MDEQDDIFGAAADALEHYHTDHTEDAITRFRGKTTDIYIVSDRSPWREKFREFTATEFPDSRPVKAQLPSRRKHHSSQSR